MVCATLATGCATTPIAQGTGADHELRAQLRALASKQADLEHKIERLESRLDAQKPAATKAEAKGTVPTSLVPSNLATVKLSPPTKKAPALATEIALREPDAGSVELLLADPPEGSKPEDLPAYTEAMAALTTGDVEHGANALVAFADKHKKDARAPTALYQAGVGFLNFGDPQSAVLAFEQLANDYPVAQETPEGMVRLAECNVRLKRGERARDAYTKAVSRYPGTSAAKAAAAGLKNLAESSKVEAAQKAE